MVIKDAREWCKDHDRQCKDTAALGRINDMKAFVSITGIPVADFENKTVLKLLPAPPKSGKVPVRSSTVSVFVACHFENVANTHASPFVRHVAGVGSIADKFGMRGRETLRTVVVKNVSGPQCGGERRGLGRRAAGGGQGPSPGRSPSSGQPQDGLAGGGAAGQGPRHVGLQGHEEGQAVGRARMPLALVARPERPAEHERLALESLSVRPTTPPPLGRGGICIGKPIVH